MAVQNKVVVTGAGGFIGRFISGYLRNKGHIVTAITGSDANKQSSGLAADKIVVNLLNNKEELKNIFSGQDAIIHLAAKVHKKGEDLKKTGDAARDLEVGTNVLIANAAIEAGVPRFVFASSVAVYGRNINGEISLSTVPNPVSAYGIRKYETEKIYSALFNCTGAASCIVLRLPMVYGPGNKGNPLRLLKVASLGIPVPLKGAKHKRSFLFVGNLGDALHSIIVAKNDPSEKHKTYLLCDGDDMTSGDFYRKISENLQKRNRMIFVPAPILKLIGMTGSMIEFLARTSLPVNNKVISTLFDELRFSPELFCSDYAWTPPFSSDEGIRQTSDWYRSYLGK